VRVIAADLRFTKRPPFSRSDWLQRVASSGLPGATAGGSGGGERDVRDVIAHLLAAEGRAHENMPLRSVTAKRMTLIFCGMASLELADFTGEPVSVGVGPVPVPVPAIKRTFEGLMQTCRQAMAALESGSITALPDDLARIQTAGLVPVAVVPRLATRSAVAKGHSRGAKRGGSAAAPTVPDQVAESKLFVTRLLEQVHDFGEASPLLLQVVVTLDSEDGEALVLDVKHKRKDSRTYEVGILLRIFCSAIRAFIAISSPRLLVCISSPLSLLYFSVLGATSRSSSEHGGSDSVKEHWNDCDFFVRKRDLTDARAHGPKDMHV